MLRRLFVALVIVASSVVAHAAPRVLISPDRPSGVYEPGAKATWAVVVLDGEAPLTGSISYSVRKGGVTEIASGMLELKEGKALISATRDDPGVLLVNVRFRPAEAARDLNSFGGASFAPEKIAASTPVPDDFDAFWKGKIAQLAAIPMDAQLTPVDVGDPAIEYYKISLANIRGLRIQGQIARPAGGKNLPAALQVQGAGVYPLQRDPVLKLAREGWLAMNLIAHDLPIDESAEFYTRKNSGELRDYPGIGNDDRETSYFLPMFLGCYRAIDYLMSREDWNKRTVMVHGTSQGGYQALVTAGFHPGVTAMAANVPAGCDHTGAQAGRSPGWPNWASRQGKDKEKMLTASRYFDAMNFATRIKCPSIVGVGLADTTCPPEGIIATYNQIRSPKEIVIMPQATHNGEGHGAYIEAVRAFEKQKSAVK